MKEKNWKFSIRNSDKIVIAFSDTFAFIYWAEIVYIIRCANLKVF